MCGRFELLASSEALLDALGVGIEALGSDADVASAHAGNRALEQRDIRPTDQVLLLTNEEPRVVQRASWGFFASWSEPSPGKKPLRPFNARDDKLLTPAWSWALERQRCLVPATAFFEWRAVPGEKKKRPVRFSLRSHEPFCFAGLWSRHRGQLSCTLITTSPSTLVMPVHDRMPVILPRQEIARWLAPGAVALDSLAPLFSPLPSELMIAEERDPSGTAPPPPSSNGQLKLF